MEFTDGQAASEENVNNRGQNYVLHAFHPLKITLKMFGLYNDLLAKYSRKFNILETVGNLAYILYCIILGAWLSVNVIKYSYELYFNDSVGFSSGLATSFANVLMTGTYTKFIPISLWKLCRLEELLGEVQMFVNRTKSQTNMVFCRNVLCVLIMSCIGLGTLSTTVATFVLQDDGSVNKTSPLVASLSPFRMFGAKKVHVAASYTWIILNVIVNTGIPLSVFALFSFVAYLVCKSINQLLFNMKQAATKDMSDKALSNYRKSFGELVDIVERLDSCVNFHFGAVFVLGLIVPCLMLYGVVHDPLTKSDMQFSLSYILAMGANIAQYTFGAVILSGKMHQPLGILYRINIDNLSEKGVQELSLFISRLAGPPIGISVYGLFVIDTSTVLMLVGTLVTYAVIVVQLQPAATPS